MTARLVVQQEPSSRTWTGPLRHMAFVFTEQEARDLLELARDRGAAPDTLRDAWDEWTALQAASVITIESEAYAR